MRLVSYNILDGGLGRADPVAEILQASNADVITLIEADDLGVVERIAHRLRMDIVHAAGEQHGAAILSRLRIRESVNYAPIDLAVGTSFVTAIVNVAPGKELGIAALHLSPHARVENEQKRMGEIIAILEHLRPWRESQLPHLLCGDFNANSPIQKIERGKVKPRTQEEMDANGGVIPRDVIARVLEAGYLDTLRVREGQRAAEMGTFSTHQPGQRVDFIFAHGIAADHVTGAWIEQDRLARYASDHYPVGAEIEL